MTLYLFTKDTQNSGKSTCEGQCLAAWPPLLGEPTAGEGADQSLLGTITRYRRQHPGHVQRLAAVLLGQGQRTRRHHRPGRE